MQERIAHHDQRIAAFLCGRSERRIDISGSTGVKFEHCQSHLLRSGETRWTIDSIAWISRIPENGDAGELRQRRASELDDFRSDFARDVAYTRDIPAGAGKTRDDAQL